MHLASGLTLEEASRICMGQCQARCCRGPQYLRLSAEEVVAFKQHAAAMGVEVKVVDEADGTGSVRFPDHPEDRCPMLDPKIFACRIYAHRPSRCREFPERERPGCAISGGGAD